MAQIFGKESGYLVENQKKSAKPILILTASFFGLLLVYFLFFSNSKSLMFPAVLVVTCIMFASVFEVYANMWGKWKRGSIGESQIKEVLGKLSEEFMVFQDITIGERGGNIDFVVVGPMGVLAVEVKSHKGVISFDGQELLRNGRRFAEKNFLKQAKGGAWGINKYIKEKTGRDFFITPVIVFSSNLANVQFGFRLIENVYVLGKSDLNRLIEGNGGKLAQSDIDLISKELMQLVQKVGK